MAIGGVLHDSLWVLAAFSLATVGFYGMKSPFWPLPSTVLSGPASGRGSGLHQFDRQFLRLSGPDRGGLHEGRDRQL